MTVNFVSSMDEGQLCNRPSLFNEQNYTYWKARMHIFVQATDYEIWSIITIGPHYPTKTIDGISTLKPEREWNEQYKKLAQLNAKAMNVLYYALDANEFNRISVCTTAKEIWDTLEVTHERTNQVKESKINMLVHKYELFKIEPTKSIINMFTRFTDIVNCLQSLGKHFTNSDLIRKILKSLPRSWKSKVTAIQEAKDLNKLPLDELVDSLMTYELAQNQFVEEEESRKKKSFVLKVVNSSEDDTEGSDSENKQDEFSLITRGFKKILKGRGKLRRKKFLNKTDLARRKKRTKISKLLAMDVRELDTINMTVLS